MKKEITQLNSLTNLLIKTNIKKKKIQNKGGNTMQTHFIIAAFHPKIKGGNSELL